MLEQTILKITNLNKHYGDLHIIKGANITIKEGGIYGFVGQNGSGKTTIIRLIMGLAFADEEGCIELFGETKDKNLQKARERVDGVIENPYFYPHFTAKENLVMKAKFLGIKDYLQKIKDLLELVKLDNTGKKKVKNFSLGMKQRLAIAGSLLNSPKFLILDEPANGLDPAGIRQIRELLLDLNKTKGITILVSSHLLAELKLLATDYIVIREGMVIDQFPSKDLDKRFEKELLIECENPEVAKPILKELGVQILKQEEKLFVCLPTKDVATLNKQLVEKGVLISLLRLKNKDTEGYFMNLMGGGNNA